MPKKWIFKGALKGFLEGFLIILKMTRAFITLLLQKCMRINLQKQNFRDSLNFLVSWIARRCSRLYPNFKLRTSGTGACGQPKIKWSTISHCILNFQFFHFYWHHDMFVRLELHSINYSYLFQSSKLSEWNE